MLQGWRRLLRWFSAGGGACRPYPMTDGGRLARPLHPLAWWIWAIGMATAASRTTNPLLLAMIIAVVSVVVASRRADASWARSFRSYLILGALIITIRLVLYIVVGSRFGDHVVVTLPEVDLPTWAAGIRLGGPITLEGLLGAFSDGLRLATLIICLGAANSLANPRRLLRCVPGALYEVGTAVVVAVSVAPQLVQSVQRVRRARRLRGATERGARALRTIAIPVLSDALDSALSLAASMDSRGYGRTGDVPAAARRITSILIVSGLMGVMVGVYGVLDGTVDQRLGLPMLVGGLGMAIAGFVVSGRRARPTSYRPDPWVTPEWLVVMCGIAAAGLTVVSASVEAEQLTPSLQPLTWPSLPLIASVGVLIGILPSSLAPPVSPPVVVT